MCSSEQCIRFLFHQWISHRKGMRNKVHDILYCHIQMKDRHHSKEMNRNQKYIHGDRVDNWIRKLFIDILVFDRLYVGAVTSGPDGENE